MQLKSTLVTQLCAANIVPANLRPTYISFGNVKIHCETGEVTGLSENISEDAQQFWNHIKETIIGK